MGGGGCGYDSGCGCGCGLWWLVALVVGNCYGIGFRFCSARFWFCSGLGFLMVGGGLRWL